MTHIREIPMSILEYSGSSLVSRLHDRHAARRILSVLSFCRAVSRVLYKPAIVALFGLLLAVCAAPELFLAGGAQ